MAAALLSLIVNNQAAPPTCQAPFSFGRRLFLAAGCSSSLSDKRAQCQRCQRWGLSNCRSLEREDSLIARSLASRSDCALASANLSARCQGEPTNRIALSVARWLAGWLLLRRPQQRRGWLVVQIGDEGLPERAAGVAAGANLIGLRTRSGGERKDRRLCRRALVSRRLGAPRISRSLWDFWIFSRFLSP